MDEQEDGSDFDVGRVIKEDRDEVSYEHIGDALGYHTHPGLI